MKLKKILIDFFRALIRLTGIIFLIIGLMGFPNIFIEGGFTKNIFTLLLRLITFSTFITTGYWFVRLKKLSIIGIFSTMVISIFIPFYNLYFSTNNLFSAETYKFDIDVVFILIFLFLLTFKNSLFIDNKEINNSHDKTINNDKNPSFKNLKLEVVFMVIITIVFLIGMYITYKNNGSIYNGGSTLTPTPTITPTTIPTPTNTPTPQNTSHLIPPYKAINIQDDFSGISKLILTDKKDQQITVIQSDYVITDDYIGKLFYGDFKFSPDNNFFYYNIYFDGLVQRSVLYNIKNDKNNFLIPTAETFGFSPDSKYFYACGIGDESRFSGVKSSGVIIKQLQPEYVFLKNGGRFKCQYNHSTGKLTLSELDYEEYFENKKEVIVSQYSFSEKTGSFLKIK